MTVVGLHPEELFDKMNDGELSPLERERLQAHLHGCEVCRFEYAARLDFQEEALEAGAFGAPPTLPLRPLALNDAPLPRPRRRRSRRLVWGLAAAALISASGAVASSMVGRAEWHRVERLLSRTPAPADDRATVAAKPMRSRATAPSLSFDAPLVDAELVKAPVLVEVPAAPVLVEVPPTRTPPARAPEPSKHRGSATGAGASLPSVAVGGETASSKLDVPSPKDAPVKEPTSAAKLFGEANQARRSGDVGRASGLYHLLQDQFPASPEADLSRVTLALLLLDGGDAQGALGGFERYLAGSSRGLEAEALVGRARALGRLGRRDQEAAAWREVQRKYPGSVYGRQAGERLSALGQP